MQKSYDKKCILLDIILVSEKAFFLFKSLFKIIAAEVKSTHTISYFNIDQSVFSIFFFLNCSPPGATTVQYIETS